MIREQDEEEEDEKSGTIFFLPTHKLYLRPICKFNPGITPIAVRTSRESQTWVRNLRYNHVPTDSVTARIKITQMRCTQHTPTPVSMTPPSVQHQLTDHQKTKGHTQRAQSWRLQRLTFVTHSQTTSNGLSFAGAAYHEEHQFIILWSSRHFLRLHLKVKNVESRKEASEIGKFRQMDETVIAVVADMHSEGTTDLIAGGAAIVLMMGRELEGLSYKELDNLEPELHDGMLAPQLSIQKETTETFLIKHLSLAPLSALSISIFTISAIDSHKPQQSPWNFSMMGFLCVACLEWIGVMGIVFCEVVGKEMCRVYKDEDWRKRC
ncbi:hypothetical protein Tco_1312245 [Tanacetum coccineum]